MTFFVEVGSWPLPFAPGRVNIVNRQVMTFLANAFDIAYCPRTSSPSLGAVLRGGSTRSIRKLWGIELTILATSLSNGSLEPAGTKICMFWSYPVELGELGAALEAGRDTDVLPEEVDPSRKLDGGSLCSVGRGVERES